MKVLICEDNRDIQDLLEIIVISTGAEVVKCYNLDEVHSALNTTEVGLMIMDYWFKNKDASDLIRELKSTPKYMDVPIVIISAIPNLAQVSQDLKADAYIKKPFNVEDVKNIINQFSGQKIALSSIN